MRWLLLEEIIEIKRGQIARTSSRIPRSPYSVECLLVEMMAQTGALLVGLESNFCDDLVLAKIDNVSFWNGWREGEAIEIQATSENLRSEGAWLDGVIGTEKNIIAKGRLLLVNVGRLLPGAESSLTFYEAFMNYFKVREKIQ